MPDTRSIARRTIFAIAVAGAAGAVSKAATVPAGVEHVTLSDAQRSFYSARYLEAAAQSLELRSAAPDDLASYELRSSALLFQLKRAIDAEPDKDEALKKCASCAELMAEFARETARGQALARARLAAAPLDDTARFFLSKLDLNYIWLQLGSLGRKTGWNEYWEGRKGLDTVLKRNPGHVRARVARAWIDYIVDTKMPRGTKWILGGGSRKRALEAIREAAGVDGDFFVRVEAVFALWEMEVRERNVPEAVAAARGLARDFPENREVQAFLAAHESSKTLP